MKKLIALLLVLALSLTAVAAFADAKSNTETPEVKSEAPSKTVEDLNKSKGTTNSNKNSNKKTTSSNDDVEEDESFMIWTVQEAALVEKVNNLIKEMEGKNPAEVFGKADEIAAILGEGPYNVHEIAAVRASNADKVKGSAKVSMSFPAKYEKGTKVAVVIDAGKGWNVMSGSVKAGSAVEFSVAADLAQDIEDNSRLLAVVSK